MSRRRVLGQVAGAVAAAASARTLAAASTGPAQTLSGSAELAIRTITAGVRVAAGQPAVALARARAFLERAGAVMAAAGYLVQTLRVVTQPHGEYLDGLPRERVEAVLRAMLGALGDACRLAIGPAPDSVAGDAQARERVLLANSLGIAATISIGSATSGIASGAVTAAADVIARHAQSLPERNFSFAAIANVAPGVPFFPAGYHGTDEPTFTLGTQSAGLFLRVCREAGDMHAVEPRLLQAYTQALAAVEAVALEIERDTGWRYAGIDTTPATWQEHSMGAAVEALTGAPFGAPGSLAACRVLTRIVQSVPVRRSGYQGLFLPPLEDETLARRAYDHYGLVTLLACSSVCGTGIDAVALPGNTGREALERILLDVATLAVRLDKPLTGRLLPVPGKRAGESSGAVAGLIPMKVLDVG
ncbi:MAG: DUF711 family protein [Gammaproteobacteria bacterium]|nr:DUF711 family protein [Gammaproteobacteria bacterium]